MRWFVASPLLGLCSVLAIGCTRSSAAKAGQGLGDAASSDSGARDPHAPHDTAHGDDDDDGDEGSSGDVDCNAEPDAPQCSCDAVGEDGEFALGPCDPRCTSTTTRYSLWNTNYNVAGTFGYGEHQGLGLIGYAYRYDARFDPSQGVLPPWAIPWEVGDATDATAQFERRTVHPGGEDYIAADPLPGDNAGLYPLETVPLVPEQRTHSLMDAALCEPPQQVVDERYFNHGRTLAEQVPNHEWDVFFSARRLIPLELMRVIEVTEQPAGAVVGVADSATVEACLGVIEDGFCESRCGNCSYILPAASASGTPFTGDTPGNQIAGVPASSVAPYQRSGTGQVVATRPNFETIEAGRTVHYVGGSSWGSTEEVAEYGPSDWPDPDGVPAEPGDAWMTYAGDDTDGDGEADWWTDPFTHCFDPSDAAGSQIPNGVPRFIGGRYGHNSNSDAEAIFRQFQACAAEPQAYAQQDAWNEDACAACGTPAVEAGAAVQMPCVDQTAMAEEFWGRSPGTHDVHDFDLGKFTAVDATRSVAAKWSELPDAICSWSGEFVFGM